jgi:oxalate decarboxylase/phosphoglucose isomerase-like protein (cupin superfamily)
MRTVFSQNSIAVQKASENTMVSARRPWNWKCITSSLFGNFDSPNEIQKRNFRPASREATVSDQNENNPVADLSRRNFLSVGSTALATAALTGITAHAQEMQDTRKAEKDISASDPGQENKPLLDENPSSNAPPPTDHGDIGPVWYSFDLVHKRVEEGGWTHEVNAKVLPTSKDLAGVNMRLTAGSFRELHWHTADEWAIMLDGSARVTVMNPDGTMFIDDVNKGDLWLFPAGFPHSIQGLRPNGCEFLLVFDEGDFSEDGTFLLSETIAHTPRNILAKNFGLDKETNTRSRCRRCRLPAKRREVKSASWTRVISPCPKTSPRRS